MEEGGGFQFTEAQKPSSVDLQFKKQRAAYLAQRNARKKEAEAMLKKNRGHSTSSEEELKPALKQPPKFKIEEPASDRSSSSRSSSVKQVKEMKEKDFLQERQRYKAQRLARRHEVAKNKEVEFGPSSSSESEPVPVYKPKINVVQSPTRPLKKELKTLKNSTSKQQLKTNPFLTLQSSSSPLSQKSQSVSIHKSVRLKKHAPQKKNQRERFQIELPSKKGVNIWLQQFLEFKENSVEIGDRSVPIYDITKVKLFFIRTEAGNFKIKVTYPKEDVFFAVDHKKLNELCLDHYYYLFAKIISLKLQLMGKKPNNQVKPKLGLSEQQLKGAQITGKVRKSSFFGGWQESLGVVNQSGLCIYKQGKEKPLLTINYNTIKQLWTRFEFDSDNLIIKFLHGGSKIELSIPFQNYLSRDNWLYHIYNLASK